MKSFGILLFIFFHVFAPHPPKAYFNRLINDETIKTIRDTGASWSTYESNENPLRHFSDNDIKYLISMPGIDFEAYKKEIQDNLKTMDKPIGTSEYSGINIDTPVRGITLPESFDWRTTEEGKRCMPAVLNQGSCGACYAFATAVTVGSRYCSMTPGMSAVNYSPQDILACNVHTEGCEGGILDLSFTYVEEYGITTLSCQPYMEAKTRLPRMQKQKCMADKCASGELAKKVFCKKGTSVIVFGKDRIKYEILQRGPVATFMTVFGDVVDYKGGIYKHKSGANEGGHAVVLVVLEQFLLLQSQLLYYSILNSSLLDFSMQKQYTINNSFQFICNDQL
eukprot:TRINITY_DN607_c0_g1_i2.p1 TRINITY_DN607_c0_g1~~TRINITY_DN607_c0_g1_i2.p1  ORF type:complete len:374 (+),score=4.47 TRINITY_DN607_c0_g1_i2:113-1123(+)